jgi:predicted GNAT family acetyltransferase
MADELPIQREETETEGRYVIYLPDGSEAEMTYHKTGPQSIAIDHTGVPEAWRNKGLAIRLVEAGIQDAEANGTRIAPHCSYVAAQFRRHPEWHKLLA